MPRLSDLLSWVDSRKRVAKRNIGDLLNDPANALEKTGYQTAEELKNPDNYGPGAMKGLLGMTAWHGSPHLFDKFRMDKIGTGEGAQAYGHGLYLSESPHVAQNYQRQLTERGGPSGEAAYMKRMYKDNALDIAKQQAELGHLTPQAKKFAQDVYEILKAGEINSGQLYKTDIPDEAVARFLDWDKSLADQPSDVLDAFRSVREFLGMNNEYWSPGKLATGANEYKKMADKAEAYNVSELLRQRGIPGIRYLDGGSRGAGSGTSNFVVFSPDMIRIIERNGVPTGQTPWKPGEYKLRDLLNN